MHAAMFDSLSLKVLSDRELLQLRLLLRVVVTLYFE